MDQTAEPHAFFTVLAQSFLAHLIVGCRDFDVDFTGAYPTFEITFYLVDFEQACVTITENCEQKTLTIKFELLLSLGLSPTGQLDERATAYKDLLVRLIKILYTIKSAYPDYKVSVYVENDELGDTTEEIEKIIEGLMIKYSKEEAPSAPA